jgi:hypothetical protein
MSTPLRTELRYLYLMLVEIVNDSSGMVQLKPEEARAFIGQLTITDVLKL